MKASSLPYISGRRSNSFRASVTEGAGDGVSKSPAFLFWLLLYGLCCILSLVLGFRFSRLIFYLLFSATATTSRLSTATIPPTTGSVHIKPLLDLRMNRLPAFSSSPPPSPPPPPARSKVVVGRHGIRIRPFPHPNPEEVMRAHAIIDRVQAEQSMVYGVKNRRRVVVITPTYVRTFQTEAGGATNETASLLADSGLNIFHVGFKEQMPLSWEDRHQTEARMRLRGLRVVREQRLDGIVMFCDDSNVHSLELFDEVQSVKWMGALSVGILALPGQLERENGINGDVRRNVGVVPNKEEESNLPLPVQGPSCNSSGQLVGWHVFSSPPPRVDDGATVLPRKLEWAGFVMNSRLVWKIGDEEEDGRPNWMKDLDEISENGDELESPLSLLKDASFVEPLGKCGRKVMLWWLRVEARADSKFPRGWIIGHHLQITVRAKHTPWPDTRPEVVTASTQKMGIIGYHAAKHKAPRTRRRASHARRKHEQRVDVHLPIASRRHVEKRL
ncbi:putative beta-1-4-xylosyltransferase [Nymphaea thermarum]|nr:putative beta-1-4-xylosyltransferase [Nymphaea thermarum]